MMEAWVGAGPAVAGPHHRREYEDAAASACARAAPLREGRRRARAQARRLASVSRTPDPGPTAQKGAKHTQVP